ncbi:unnamed protein product [Periconia digitata]|uniref:SWIM-type domain-containing protein n=1 Tax=Periconia digitata TaxID=1303443 RepID=A0A9W4XGD7_9PLEO|nr:unnamed protein product [Periconia digitata]
MSSSNDLTSPREFVTKLLTSLNALGLPQHAADVTTTTPASAQAAVALNPLSHASEPVRKHLMTLHVLFPNELLPALDLLDRKLVTRFHIRRRQPHPQTGIALRDGSRAAVTTPAKVTSALANESNAAGTRGDGQLQEIAPANPHPNSDTDDATTLHHPDTDPQVAGPYNHAVGSKTRFPRDPSINEPHTENVDNIIPTTAHVNADAGEDSNADLDTVYYVRSAQHRSSRFSTSYEANTSYEVRLRAWNCSCPAFTFSAFPNVFHPQHLPSSPLPAHHQLDGGDDARPEEEEKMWNFGGLSLDNEVMGANTAGPVCKHLLACVLSERCEGLFGGFVVNREVGCEEAAGWAAGWGD